MRPKLQLGDLILVRQAIGCGIKSLWGIFNHIDKGGRIVYKPANAKDYSRCGWRDILEHKHFRE